MTDNPRYQQIWSVVSNIPYASVITYGDVARLAGLPGCARLVSTALRAAPATLKLPWYRVINAQGKISFPQTNKYYALQKKRLIAEGVVFSSERINLEKYRVPDAMDIILWQQSS